MELLIMISTACLMGIFWCLLSFEKRTQILMRENRRLTSRVEKLEEEKEKVERFYKLFYASNGVKK